MAWLISSWPSVSTPIEGTRERTDQLGFRRSLSIWSADLLAFVLRSAFACVVLQRDKGKSFGGSIWKVRRMDALQ